MITQDDSWYDSKVGGVAYLNSFEYTQDIPCWVFSSNLGTAKNVAEAVSHEVGHTLGLSHDGDDVEEYYRGAGDWAPIMGVGYSRKITQFSRGVYQKASNTENDWAIMMEKIAPRSDQIGNSMTDASPLYYRLQGALGVIDSAINMGIINDSSDLDYFWFSTTGGALDLQILPSFSTPSNLFFSAVLSDSTGFVWDSLAVSTRSIQAGIRFQRQLPIGKYFIKLQGEALSDPLVGFPAYGSVGRYAMMGNIEGVNHLSPLAIKLEQWDMDPLSCASTSARLRVRNTGGTELQKITVAVVGSNFTDQQDFLVSLQSGSHAILNLDQISFGSGKQAIAVKVNELNGQVYHSNQLQDTIIVGPGVEVEVVSDAFTVDPNFTWQLTDGQGFQLSKVDPEVHRYEYNKVFYDAFCLLEGKCYDFAAQNPFLAASCPGWPEFSLDSAYQADDYFAFNGEIYFVLQDCQGLIPDQNPAYFFSTGPCPAIPQFIYLRNHAADTLIHLIDTSIVSLQSSFCLDPIVGSEEINLAPEFTLYPNPARDQLNVSVSARYQLLSADGRFIATVEGSTFEVSFLPAGVYILRNEEGRAHAWVKY